eukprot:CAMPEP_0174326462 /NCGR_PEP_ID=MMETSP0810-20121108/13920_1 /TAXON_ID=73025 ORGANISM="Eutreptiella gymnastica-like, Strain CCMP1594" /NCGR_SAMPLE_ID=MMETSP0810 /ASSEMBLY_ACC=CAM_ASM_000659 /LENGTH=559 /DNA_ID=CAMNT_0015440091 /DNA_START=34 /DNA_END=1713 /DNA_ORIENTATION=-
MASSMVAVYYKSMEEHRSTPLRRSASPTIANYGLSSTRTILGTPSRYRSASPGIVDYGSSSTQAMRAAPSRRSSTSASIAQYTMLATPSALTPLSRSQSPSTATHDGFPVVRTVRPLSSQPAVPASRTRLATTPSLTEHVHPLTVSSSASGQYPFRTHGYSQMQGILQYDMGSYTVHPPSQAITPTTPAHHGPMEIEADGHVVRDSVDTEKVVEARARPSPVPKRVFRACPACGLMRMKEEDVVFAMGRDECDECVKASLGPATPHEIACQAWMHHLLLQGHHMDSETLQLCQNAIKSVGMNFPGAMPDRQMLALLLRTLKKTIPDFSKDNTLLGTSFCPDEISNEKGDLPNLLYEEFGKCFHLGGLAGIPFTGKTGFKAFASHVPTNGHIVICYGPHVGISPDGEVGKFLRPGQSHLTTACGACVGALAAAESGKCQPCQPVDAKDADEDYQMNYIIQQIGTSAGLVNQHPRGKMVGLAYESFRVAQRRAEAMLDLSCLNGGSVVLLGGIQINMSDPLPDFFLPLSCCVYRDGQQPERLEHMISEGNMFSGRPVGAHR